MRGARVAVFAVLHALHCHEVDVATVQAGMGTAGRTGTDDLLTPETR